MTLHAPRPGLLRLASYNVRKCIGLDRRRDPQRVLRAIAALQADIVILQEADKRLGARPSAFLGLDIEEETGLVPWPVGRNKVSLGWHGNAILARPGLAAEGIEHLDLPALEPRGALIARVRTPEGAVLQIAGAHLALTARFRRRQAHRIADALDPKLPAVIAGDFNEWRPLGALAPLAEEFHLVSPGRSYHASRPVASLDRIALRGIEAEDCGVMRNALSRRASDHLPIWADLRLPTAGGKTRRAGAGARSRAEAAAAS